MVSGMDSNCVMTEEKDPQIEPEPEDDGFTSVLKMDHGQQGLVYALKDLAVDIVCPRERAPFIQRTKRAVKEHAPIIRHSARNSSENVMHWVQQGGPWRAVLIISVGTISLLSLTGLAAFMLFFLAATANAIVVGLLMSLAAVGGFMALFFAFLTAIYVGALSIAAVVISVATLMTISAVAVVGGWIGFFWLLWQAIRKSLDITRSSLLMTTSALSAITDGHVRNINVKKHS